MNDFSEAYAERDGVCVQTDKLRDAAEVWSTLVPEALRGASSEIHVGANAGEQYFSTIFAAIKAQHDGFVSSVENALRAGVRQVEAVGEGLDAVVRILESTDEAIAEGARQNQAAIERV